MWGGKRETTSADQTSANGALLETRACLKSETGKLSGRPVSYNTPSCGWVGVELSVGQVNRDHSTTSQWTLAYMLFQSRFHVQARCVKPYKRFARLSMPGLHNKRIVPALVSTPVPNKYGSSLSLAGNKKTGGNWEKKFKRRHKNPFITCRRN